MFSKAVIDTGPLFSALILNYYKIEIEFGRPITAAGLEDPLRDRAAQKLFLELLSSIQQKLTTSHVIGELRGLQGSRLKLHEDDRLDFWQTSIDLLRLWKVDERLIRLLDLASDESLSSCLPRIGHCDAGLIDLARRNGCVLITEDERTLAPEAWHAGVDCRLVKQLVKLL